MGLCIHPPDHAPERSVDEKIPIQALQRHQASLLLQAGPDCVLVWPERTDRASHWPDAATEGTAYAQAPLVAYPAGTFTSRPLQHFG